MEPIHKSYYAIIPANVRYDKNLNANSKLLYGEITALCNEKGYCWASNQYFSELYNVSRRSISSWVNTLIQYGYLRADIVYKKGSKEVEERRLSIGYPIDKNVHTPMEEKFHTPMEEKFHTPMEEKFHTPMEEKFHTPMEEKFQDNNKDINNKDIYSRVVDHLNKKTDSSFKSRTIKTQGLIKARIAEGFTEEEFIKVIDNKVSEWVGTEYEKYLRPETLFGTKFESYLNQKVSTKTATKNQESVPAAYKPFEFD